MTIHVTNGVGQPMNPHVDLISYTIFQERHPPLPCYLLNGSVAPDGEYEGEIQEQYWHIQINKWCSSGPDNWDKTGYKLRQIYLCQADTEADVKKEQNSPEDFKKLAIEKLTELFYRTDGNKHQTSYNQAVYKAIDVIKAL